MEEMSVSHARCVNWGRGGKRRGEERKRKRKRRDEREREIFPFPIPLSFASHKRERHVCMHASKKREDKREKERF
jgi:hypothetical protein